MDAFGIEELRAARAVSGRSYHEFISVPDLSAGVYELAAGATDGQQPHTEDELYHVVRGRARIVVAGETRPVGPADTVFVAANVPHRFVDIEEDLVLLVVFGPAEYSRRPR